jgi:hypothetical protein
MIDQTLDLSVIGSEVSLIGALEKGGLECGNRIEGGVQLFQPAGVQDNLKNNFVSRHRLFERGNSFLRRDPFRNFRKSMSDGKGGRWAAI